MLRNFNLLIVLVLAACLSGCTGLGALTPREATRQSLQQSELNQEATLVLGEHRLPDGKSLVIFSFTPATENGKSMTGLGYSLLERSRLGIWKEVSRGTYIKEALALAGETIDYEIANQPGELEAVFGRAVDPNVSEVLAIYDDQHEKRDRNPRDGFAFFSEMGSYPATLQVMDGDGKILQTVELTLMESVARETLTKYFSYLHDELYAEASQLYAGSYQPLIDMNSLIHPADHPALWENACKVNGFQCLYVSSIGLKEKISPGEFIFLVEFMDEQGNTFQQGPCCGESGSSTQAAFEFRVKKAQDGQFKVFDLPVYVP